MLLEEDNLHLTDEKFLCYVGFQNKQRRLHSCNKRGQAVWLPSHYQNRNQMNPSLFGLQLWALNLNQNTQIPHNHHLYSYALPLLPELSGRYHVA